MNSKIPFFAAVAALVLTGCDIIIPTQSTSASSFEPESSIPTASSESSNVTSVSSAQALKYEGHGEPSSDLGKPGDTYVDVDSGATYVKSKNEWVKVSVASSLASSESSSSVEVSSEASSFESVFSSASSEIPSSSSSSASVASSYPTSFSSSSSSSSTIPISSVPTSSSSSSVTPISSYSSSSSSYSSSSSSSSSVSSSSSSSTSEPTGYYKANIADAEANFYTLGQYNESPTLASVGSPKLLVLPIEFSNSPFTKSRLADIQTAIAGTAEETNYWESLHSFYSKSSYGKLDFQFVFADKYTISTSPSAWYKANKSTLFYTEGSEKYTYEDSPVDLAGLALTKAVENYKKKTGDDCQQFDQDGDGMIDACIMIYSCHNMTLDSSLEAYGDLFWAYQYSVYTDDFSPDVSSPIGCRYFWSSYDFFYEGVEEGEGVDAHTLIHEMGHILGADDYYNYAHGADDATDLENAEPSGSAIMMSHNILDHDAFTKLCYGWVDPYVVTDSCTITINPSESSGDCILLADSWNGTCFDEFVIFELYTPTGLNELDSKEAYNDCQGPTSYGVRAYHIDNRLYYDSGESYAVDSKDQTLLSDSETTNFSQTIKKDNQDHYISPAVTNTATFDAQPIVGKGYELIQIIQRGKTNTTKNGNAMSAKDLFKTGDTFTLSSYSAFFPNKTKLNNGKTLPYSVHFDSVTSTSATLTFTKTA